MSFHPLNLVFKLNCLDSNENFRTNQTLYTNLHRLKTVLQFSHYLNSKSQFLTNSETSHNLPGKYFYSRVD